MWNVLLWWTELDEFLLELDEDVEGMQSTIYFLQQQLRQTREQLATVQKENEMFRSSSNSSSSLTQCQLAGESSHNTPERSESYMQTNGILDHSIHQNEFSSPEQLDPDTAAPAAESDVKQPTKRNTVTSHQSSGLYSSFCIPAFSVVGLLGDSWDDILLIHL